MLVTFPPAVVVAAEDGEVTTLVTMDGSVDATLVTTDGSQETVLMTTVVTSAGAEDMILVTGPEAENVVESTEIMDDSTARGEIDVKEEVMLSGGMEVKELTMLRGATVVIDDSIVPGATEVKEETTVPGATELNEETTPDATLQTVSVTVTVLPPVGNALGGSNVMVLTELAPLLLTVIVSTVSPGPGKTVENVVITCGAYGSI